MRISCLPFVCLAPFLMPSASSVALERPCANEKPCEISGENGGTYYLRFPKGWDGKSALKPFVFFHGHNGSGVGVVRGKGMVREITGKGYLLVAPDGPLFNFRGRDVRGWAARSEGENPRGRRDDIAFVDNVLADLARKIPVRQESTVVSGFSSGGSMAWYFGCYSKQPVAALVSVAGGLRRPLPEGGIRQEDGSLARKCPGGARKVLHIHGFTDNQVPLEGRGIRSWHQGDVFEGLAVQRHTNQCGSRPDKIEAKGAFWCRTWNKCVSGKPIRFCLHPGGHGMPKDWISETFKWVSKP